MILEQYLDMLRCSVHFFMPTNKSETGYLSCFDLFWDLNLLDTKKKSQCIKQLSFRLLGFGSLSASFILSINQTHPSSIVSLQYLLNNTPWTERCWCNVANMFTTIPLFIKASLSLLKDVNILFRAGGALLIELYASFKWIAA